MTTPIPVVCDRCRAEGFGGAEPFADLGDLLEFEPVPRRPRVDGWTAELQRAFIAALAVTGSDRQAARAVGKAQFGVEQLKQAKGNEGFMAARAKALAMAASDRSRRLAAGLHAVTAQAALWRPPDPAWSKAATRGGRPPAPAPDQAAAEEDEATRLREGMAWLERILRLYLIKLDQEHEARLEGDIAAADLYIRQITCLEVVLDLVSVDCRIDPVRLIGDCHRGGFHLVQIAETPLSRLLDEARRAHHERCGDPPRPEPPRHLYVQHDGFATQPGEHARSGQALSLEEQWQWWKEQHARDAEAHIEWFARARRDFADRRAAARPQGRETDRAGQPAPGPDPGDRTDVTGFTPVTATAPDEPTPPNPGDPDEQ